MAVVQLAPPDLSIVSVGDATLVLMEAIGFSKDENTLLVRATFLDSGETDPYKFNYAVWTYDLVTQSYTECLNQSFATALSLRPADINVISAESFQNAGQSYFLGELGGLSSASSSSLHVLDPVGGVTDLLAGFVEPGASIAVERYSISKDGRFLAVQTSSPLLAPVGQLDVNDVSDVYLLDLLTNNVAWVSTVAGASSNEASFLGNVNVSGGVVSVAFGSAGTFSSADRNALLDNPADVYLWKSSFDASGFTGSPAVVLQSKSVSGQAAGFVDLQSPILATGGGVLFNSTAADIVGGDTNASADPFLSSASSLSRISLSGVGELDTGAIVLSATADGRYIALLTSSPEISGATSVQQVIVVDNVTGRWRVASINDRGAIADIDVTSGALSPDGAYMAFTSTATNLTGADPSALGGSLFLVSTGLIAPTGIVLSANTLRENNPTDTSVGSLGALDPDADVGPFTVSQSYQYSFASGAGDADNSLFEIVGSELRFRSVADYELKNGYSVRVQVSDSNGSAQTALRVFVTDVNEAPLITSGGAVSVAENVQSGTPVYTVTATDPDAGTTLSYSIIGGVDAGRFQIDGGTGALSFVTAPDFEAPADVGGDNVYDVVVQVSDGALSDSQAIAVTVTDANDAPFVAAGIADQSAAAGSGFSFQFASTAFGDVDAGDTLSYAASRADGSPLPAWLSFEASTRTFSGTPGAGDVGTLSVRVTATDQGAASVSDSFDLKVLSNEPITLTVSTIGAAELNALDAGTVGVVNAGSVTVLTGSVAEVVASYRAPGITGLGNEAVTLSGTAASAADLTAIDGYTSGLVDAAALTSLTGSVLEVKAAYGASGITGLGNEAVTLTGTAALAVDLNAVNAATTGTVDMGSILTVTGSLADLTTTYAALGFTGRGNEDLILLDAAVAAADLSGLDSRTAGVIDASSVTSLTGTYTAVTAALGSPGITGLGSAGVTLSDTKLGAAALNSLDDLAGGVINAASVTWINSGTAAEVAIVYGASGITGLGGASVTLSGTIASAVDLNTIDAATSGPVNMSSVLTVTGALADLATTYASAGLSGRGNEAITLSDTSVAVADLNSLDLKTTGVIDAATVTSLSGSATALAAAYTSSGISGLGNEAVTLTGTTATAAELRAIDGATTVQVNAASVTALVSGTVTDVLAVYNSSGISGLGDEAVTLSGTLASAADLNAVNTATSGTVNMGSILTVTGSLADLTTTYTAPGVTGLGNEALTLSDTTLAAVDLSGLDARTTGLVNAASVTSLSGTYTAVTAALGSAGITGLGSVGVTLSDTKLGAAALNSLDGRTTGVINAASVTWVNSGTATEIAALYGSSGITGLGSAAVTLTGTAATAKELNTINSGTSGTVNMGSVLTVTGGLADLAVTYTAAGFSGRGNEAVTVTDTTAAAANLVAVDTGTTGLIDLATVTVLTGTTSEVAAAYASTGTTGLGDEAVTLSGTTATAAELNAINAATSGTVNMASILTVTGSLTDLNTTYTALGFTGRGNEAITLSDKTAVLTDLNNLDARTSGVINASSVTLLTGSASAATTAFASSGISGLGNEAVTLSDTKLGAASLNSLDGRTTGVINAAAVTWVNSGLASEVAAVYASSGITGLGSASVTLSGTTATAKDLNAINAATTGAINAGAILTVTGSIAEVTTTYTTPGFSSLGNKAITLTDTTATAASLNSLDLLPTGLINAASVTLLTGTAAAAMASFASSGITGLGSAAVTLSDTKLGGASLASLDSSTSGIVNAATVTWINSGTAAEVAVVYGSSGFSGLGNESVTLSGTTASAANLNTINLGTTGTVNMGAILTVTGGLSDLNTLYSATGLSGRGNEAVTLSDTTAAAASLNSLDGLTTGLINAASVTLLTGTAAAVSTAFASAGITGLGNAAIDVTGSNASDTITATSWNDIIDGAGGADILSGGLGSDSFVFVAGQANGDTITDFSGLTGQNDSFVFEGYGAGATFTDLGSGQLEIANAARTIVDVITVNTYSSGDNFQFIL